MSAGNSRWAWLWLKRSCGLICSAYRSFWVIFVWFCDLSRMRDPPGIDNLLLKKLKVCCAKEDSFLPREMGLKLMESTPAEVTYFVSRFPAFLHLQKSICCNSKHFCVFFPSKELQRGVCKVQRQPGGGTLGSDHFLWLQHSHLRSSCQFAWQIPHLNEGNTSCRIMLCAFMVLIWNPSLCHFW